MLGLGLSSLIEVDRTYFDHDRDFFLFVHTLVLFVSDLVDGIVQDRDSLSVCTFVPLDTSVDGPFQAYVRELSGLRDLRRVHLSVVGCLCHCWGRSVILYVFVVIRWIVHSWAFPDLVADVGGLLFEGSEFVQDLP